MTQAKATRWTGKRVAVVAGVVPATIGASVLHASVIGGWDAWFASGAAVSGGLFGHLVWVCLDVRRRVTRLGAILVGACAAVWSLFFLFGATHEWPQASVRSDGSFEFATDLPVMVAGRAVGVFGSVNAADRLLTVLAGPAVGFADLVVGLATGNIEHTVAQSYAVAGVAVVLSAAWWLAVGNALSVYRRRRRDRRAAVPVTTA